jgi:surfactin synthase thioesterase subunit/3-oxoacyl-(acyl-carrier-protein) synthase
VLDSGDAVAIVGLAAQSLGAADVEEFWLKLMRGRDATRDLADGPPRACGVPEEPFPDLMLEVAYAAIENAGYDPTALSHDVGVFAGAGIRATDVADRLRLRGPAFTCRTDYSGFIALRLASQSVRAGACGMALVTGAAVTQPEAGASGASTVVVKRLRDALADHDHVWAVIRGIACADGALDRSPAAEVIRAAMALAGARPEDVSYVEACGSGSPSAGEVAALTEAYASLADRSSPVGLCGVGAGLGTAEHLGPVALAGLVKVALALDREQLPASIIARWPDLSGTPFHATDRITPWPRDPRHPRLAAVSALGAGVGGHVVLAEAPAQACTMHAEEPCVVVWSGRTAADERGARERLARYFVWHGEALFTDAVATLQHGRATHPVRAAAVCTGALDAASVLGAVDSPRVLALGCPAPTAPPVTLLFPGRGSALAARALYRDMPVFARALDGWLDLLDRQDLPVRDRWHGIEAADPGVADTDTALLFAVEAALGQVWQEAGVRPSALVGDGIGALAAALAAEVFAPADAATLVQAVVRTGAAGPLGRAVAGVCAKRPAVPLLCAPAGRAVTIAEAGDPAFWARMLRTPAGATDGFDAGGGLLVAAGPGPELTVTALLTTAARMWTQGCDIAWESLGQPPVRHRVPMPGSGFRCVTDSPPPRPLAAAIRAAGHRRGATPVNIEVLTPPGSGPLILAIPYAGGSGRVFRSVRGYIPAGCGLALVDLPGHGRQLGRQCLRDVDAVLDELLAALPTLPTPRLLLLGYSLGGSFSYELAARLAEAGTPPEGMIVCGTRSPQTGVGHPPVAHLPAGEPFLRTAVSVGLAAREMLELPELAESFAGPLQADLAMVERFPYRPRRPPLPVPVCVVGMREDWIVPEPSLRAWDDLCLDPPLQLRVDGGHLALHERQREFGTAIRRAVEHVLNRTATHAPTDRNTTSASSR